MKTAFTIVILLLSLAGLANAQNLQQTNTSTTRAVPQQVPASHAEPDKPQLPNPKMDNVSVGKFIEFDFKLKGIPNLTFEEIEEGEYYQLIIYNINQNLYKISYSKADSVLSKRQETPTFGAFNMDALSKVVAGISPLSTVVGLMEADKQFVEVQKSAAKWEGDNSFPKAATPSSKIETLLKKEREAMGQYKTELEETARKIDDLKLKVYKTRLNSYRSSNSPGDTDYAAALGEIEEYRAELRALNQGILTSKSNYETDSEALNIPSFPTYASTDKEIKALYDKFITAITTIETSINADKAHELLFPLVTIDNNKVNNYVSLPIQYMGEQTRMVLTITPRDEKLNLHSYVLPITFPTQIEKYTSVGISFYTASIYDRAYSTIQTQDTEADADSLPTYSFVEEDVDRVELGLAAMLRYGRKFGERNNYGFHGSIGAGVSVSNKIKPRALFGGGMSFGKKHMLAIDLGAIAGYVDKKSNQINEGEDYLSIPSNIVVSRIGLGAFISIGYLYQF